ncbi:MAG: lgt [Gammaproteobacteria bacterium]|jgi:phosphatidylglycerol:prolipoprotein diacylglycerol transferase|nr:lgt [Gammaproteobacteria bacterium]
MLNYPHINNVALHIGPFAIHWYGLMYLIGFLSAWALASYRIRKHKTGWSAVEVSDLIFYTAIGVIIGGRLGYMLFYDFSGWIAEPLSVFKIWQGGMSFHGGFIGVFLAICWFCYCKQKTIIEVSDFISPLVPIGLAAGRLGNFINGELWGRPTHLPWGMVFPHVDPYARHPSQLYEFLLEGVILFMIVWVYSAKRRSPAAVTGVFLTGYGLARIVCEFFREPDLQLGFIAWGWVTIGQLLSLPVLVLGIICFIYAYNHRENRSQR